MMMQLTQTIADKLTQHKYNYSTSDDARFITEGDILYYYISIPPLFSPYNCPVQHIVHQIRHRVPAGFDKDVIIFSRIFSHF